MVTGALTNGFLRHTHPLRDLDKMNNCTVNRILTTLTCLELDEDGQ